jgi:quercetin dioxygenase-like cupin family protein
VIIVPKDWGEEHWIVNNDLYCGKKLILRKGFRCSLHYHKVKHETFYVESGLVQLSIPGGLRIMRPGDRAVIKPTTVHRFTGLEDSVIFEFSTHHEDSDSYRIEPSGPAP